MPNYYFLNVPTRIANVSRVDFKTGDTSPSRVVQLVDGRGMPVPLPDPATVRCIWREPGGDVVRFARAAVILSRELGIVCCHLQAGDTASAGVLWEEWEVTLEPGGGVLTFPSDGYVTVQVKAGLG